MTVKYKTLESSIASFLDDQVSQHLELGWELHGNPYYTGIRYVQVVILKEENEDKTKENL
jgi:hypothetical protein